jgi:hypothetical protein
VVRVSRLLGQASPKIKLDVHSHAAPTERYATAEKIAAVVFGNKMETSNKKRVPATTVGAANDAQVDDLVAANLVARGGIKPPTRGFSGDCEDDPGEPHRNGVNGLPVIRAAMGHRRSC